MSGLRWKRIVSYYARPASFSTGGVNTSRQQWMGAYGSLGIPVLIVSARHGFDLQLISNEEVKFTTIPHLGKHRVTMVPIGLVRLLRKDDLVYLHEGWTLSNLVVSWICRIRAIDYVVIPHGVYAPSITRLQRGYRLRRYLEASVTRHALAVHLFFESEVPELRKISEKAVSFVSVTGFTVPEETWSPSDSNRYISWVGRYDIHHKGIDILLGAFASISPELRPTLKMHGPDHLGDKRRVRDLVSSYGLEPWVHVGEELSPTETQAFIRRSIGFVHVPRWEAFGRTIVEAMSLGCPVVLGDDAHISAVLDPAGAAYVVDGSDIAAIAAGVTELWQSNIETGPAGREWVLRELSWQSRATHAMSELSAV